MKSSFLRRLILSHVVVIVFALAFTAFQLTRRLHHHFLEQLEESLATQTSLLAPTVDSFLTAKGPRDSVEKAALEIDQRCACRVTFVRLDGTVLADSERSLGEIASMDNHLQRPEIQQAEKSGLGQAIRHSQTLHENMLYVARKSNQGYIRLALPLTEVENRIAVIQRDLAVAGAMAIGLVVFLAYLSAKKASRPLMELARYAEEIGQGRFRDAPDVLSSDEFGRLAQTFKTMAARIQEKVSELSQERTQLSAILSGMVESVVAIDPEGRILFLNKAAAKLFQVQSDQANGRPVLEILRHSPLSEFLGRAAGTREAVSQEIIVHLPEDHVLAAHAVPFAYGSDQRGVLVILHDVSDLRKLERVRQEFVANVSHELKTPLTAIQWYTETLLDGGLKDTANNREFLQIMLDQAKRLGRLIDDILDLSAMEARRMPFNLEPVALPEVAERLVQALTPMAQAKKVQLTTLWPKNLPKVLADREKLAQVLLNLIDNAIKFNKEGGSVEISGLATASAVAVTVKDSGTGIPAEDLPRIFERFYRVDKARSREMGGTGLGLSIVKHLLEHQRGEVTVESRLGEGSSFRFTLPAQP